MTKMPAPDSLTIANSIYNLLRTGKFSEAVVLCEKALQRAPTDALLLDAMGMIHAHKHELGAAETCFRAALEINPDQPNTLNNLGNILRETFHFDEAAQLYRRLIDILPEQAAAHTNLGKALIGGKNPKSARLPLKHALKLDPTYNRARLILATLASDDGNHKEAVTLLEAGISLNPNTAELHKFCANLYIQFGDIKRGVSLLKDASKIAPEDFEIWFALGNQLSDQLKFKEAERALRNSLKAAPLKSEIHNSLGILFKNQEKPALAIPHYHKALELNAANAKAHNNLGNALVDLEKPSEALLHFNKAIALEPDFDEAYINRVHTLDLSPGHPEIQRLKGYLTSDRLSDDIKTNLLFALGKIHDEMGLYKDAYQFTHQGNMILAAKEKFDRLRHRSAIASVISSFKTPVIQTSYAPQLSLTPIFIIGMSRSGKTLTEAILANHPDVYAGGERSDWQNIVKSLRDELALKQPFPQFIDELTDPQIQAIGRRYISAIKEDAGDAHFSIDTMPSNFPYVGLIFKALPNVKIITCERHLLDNCLYAYFQRYKRANAYSYDLRDAASFFADYHRMIAHWRHLYEGKILSQTYEDLVGDPATTTKRLFEYCDLELKTEWIPTHLSDQEVGRWHNYTEQLTPLINWLNHEATPPPNHQDAHRF